LSHYVGAHHVKRRHRLKLVYSISSCHIDITITTNKRITDRIDIIKSPLRNRVKVLCEHKYRDLGRKLSRLLPRFRENINISIRVNQNDRGKIDRWGRKGNIYSRNRVCGVYFRTIPMGIKSRRKIYRRSGKLTVIMALRPNTSVKVLISQYWLLKEK